MHRYIRAQTKAREFAMSDQLHLGRADLNPAGRFKRPMDVVEAAGLPIEGEVLHSRGVGARREDLAASGR
jgi:hypothetical protein